MPRIRTIKPQFPQSETIGNLTRDARLLFIQLWTLVDDEGRTRAASRMLASLLYPFDEDAPKLIDGWLEELETNGCVRRYVVDGKTYLDIPNFLKHQKIDHPSKSQLPEFREHSRGFESLSRGLAWDKDKEEDSKKESFVSSLRSETKGEDAIEFEEAKICLLKLKVANPEKELRKLLKIIGFSDGLLGIIQSAERQNVTNSITYITSLARAKKAKANGRDDDADLFRKGKEVLGEGSGGLIANLKKSFGGSIPKTRAAIETASTKYDPREYVGRIIAGHPDPELPEQIPR